MRADETRRYKVSIGVVTIEVEVEASDEHEALTEGLESLRQAREADLEPGNLTVEEVVA